MKARISPSSKQKEEIKRLAHDNVSEYLKTQSLEIAAKNMKLMCVALNESFGFGAKRISKLLAEVGRISAKSDDDEIFWEHIDKRLAQMGITINIKSKENEQK